MEIIRVPDRNLFKTKVRELLADNFVMQQLDTESAVLSRKKNFNWPLAFILLFVPVIGWIALIIMILAAGRGAHVVEVQLVPALGM